MSRISCLPLRCAFALSLAATTLVAQAQAWPTKAVTLIVPYAAGGPTDVIARLVAKKLGADLGHPFIIDNRGGAGGTIGVNAAIKAPADGYTFALTGPGPLAGMPTLMKMPYAATDYQYVTLVARVPAVIVVKADSDYASLADLVAKSKAAPGKLNYGSAGNGTTPHIGLELFKQEAGLDIAHVPYKGAAPAVTALLGGEVQVAMVDLAPALPFIVGGKLRALAVASSTRAVQLPNVPTTKEAGLPNVLMDTTYGLITPKGVPAEIVKKLQVAVASALQSAEIKEQFLKQGAVATSSSPDEYAKAMQGEYDKWKLVVARGKISLD